jgi:hypothetical protein
MNSTVDKLHNNKREFCSIIGQKYRVLKKYIEIKKPEEKTREIALHSRQQ